MASSWKQQPGRQETDFLRFLGEIVSAILTNVAEENLRLLTAAIDGEFASPGDPCDTSKPNITVGTADTFGNNLFSSCVKTVL